MQVACRRCPERVPGRRRQPACRRAGSARTAADSRRGGGRCSATHRVPACSPRPPPCSDQLARCKDRLRVDIGHLSHPVYGAPELATALVDNPAEYLPIVSLSLWEGRGC